jgi:hypothetical protein
MRLNFDIISLSEEKIEKKYDYFLELYPTHIVYCADAAMSATIVDESTEIEEEIKEYVFEEFTFKKESIVGISVVYVTTSYGDAYSVEIEITGDAPNPKVLFSKRKDALALRTKLKNYLFDAKFKYES